MLIIFPGCAIIALEISFSDRFRRKGNRIFIQKGQDMKKKIISVLTVLAIIIGTVPLGIMPVFAASSGTAVASTPAVRSRRDKKRYLYPDIRRASVHRIGCRPDRKRPRHLCADRLLGTRRKEYPDLLSAHDRVRKGERGAGRGYRHKDGFPGNRTQGRICP